MKRYVANDSIVLAGHPFSTIGMGEHVRCTSRSLENVGYPHKIRDIYAMDKRTDPGFEKEFATRLVFELSPQVNIFHINGDEVDQALLHMKGQTRAGAYNIIYPVWELSKYPEAWVKYLEEFNEVWSPSKFVFDAFFAEVKRPIYHMPLPVEVNLKFYLGRRYFSLPESSYLFLFYFDFRSYTARKNPSGIIAAFEKLMTLRPNDDIRLVIKLNTPSDLGQRKADFDGFMAEIDRVNKNGNIIVLNKLLTDNETKNLVRCCDCFVSLHRSEGFGRGLAEAMYLEKPVIATGYSGNMDYMNPDNSCIVDYNLIDVKDGEYPYAKGQVWADADIDQAVKYMSRLVEDQDYGMKLGQIASRHIRTYFSYRAAGLDILPD